MKKKSFWVILAAVVLSLVLAAKAPEVSPAAKADKSKPGKTDDKKKKKQEEDAMKALGAILEHRFTPVIKSVSAGSAAANKPISVTVSVEYDDSRAKDKVKQVRVFFSADNGKTWKKPANLKKKGASWTGNIPKQKKGKLLYYVWVKDSRGNVTTELPCKVSTWPPTSDKCMIKGAVDPDPSDDKTNRIANNLDFWTVKVGMDDTYIYLQQSVEGKIDKGTMNPTRINSYIALMADASIIKELDSLEALMGQGQEAMQKKFKGKENYFWAMIYSPLGKGMLGAKKDCFAPRAKPGAAPAPPKSDNKDKGKGKGNDKGKGAQPMEGVEFNTTDITCSAPGKSPNLFFRLKKSAVPGTMQKEVVVLGGANFTVTNTNPEAFGFKIGDITNLTRMVFNPRTITVK